MHDHRALDGETERVLGRERNVWPELITVGTVMRPMVSDMGCGLKAAGPNADSLERAVQNAVGAGCRDRHSFQVGQPLGGARNEVSEPDLRNGDKPAKWIRRNRKSPGGRRQRCPVLEQDFATTPAAARALRQRHWASILGLTFGTLRALISGIPCLSRNLLFGRHDTRSRAQCCRQLFAEGFAPAHLAFPGNPSKRSEMRNHPCGRSIPRKVSQE